MQTREFLNQLDHDRIVRAIGEAELLTSGEVRVFVSKKPADDPVRAAEREFTRLGMTKTAERNAVLLYVSPVSQSFAIVGDQGIHEKCGQPFWCEVAEAMRNEFLAGHLTAGVVAGIMSAGQALQKHFPRQPDDKNELPDHVIEG
jgi:uncharacterized membrane protein